MRRLLGALSTIIVIFIGFVTLLGLLISANPIIGLTPIPVMVPVFLELVSITIAVTVLIGIFNLLAVHLGRLFGRKPGWIYSFFLLISLLGVIILTILERLDVLNLEPALTTILLEQVQVSIESALAGLLLFALVYGASRVLRKRTSGWGLLFVVALLIVLIGALPLPDLALVATVRDWLLAVPVSAGARGILLGIALATVVTGIRVLIGQDRSYRE